MTYDDGTVQLYQGDALTVLKTLPDETVQCVVTSPPYWGLRDYQVAGQLGLEVTPEEYVAAMVAIFREVRRVLRKDGTCWVNLGDSYANDGKWGGSTGGKHVADLHGNSGIGRQKVNTNLKPKDLIGIPWRVAFALQADGWWLRSDIIWAKPNPMPESVTDRPTKSHEYLFLLSKAERYYYDQEATREPLKESSIERLSQPTFDQQTGGPKDYGHRTNANRSARKALCNLKEKLIAQEKWGDRYAGWEDRDKSIGRNMRTVWKVPTSPFPEAHFATFPSKLIEPCVLAGSKEGDIILDPFSGAGTTAMVAKQLGRRAIGIELNPAYIAMSIPRMAQEVLTL